ncbi:TonB-dependent receptor [Pedobacter duraquae]|uniref:Iron complex outermembrane receptor protein n=1 Tax=Pedobacter duraquae TaxID=425511 RepID=A0A4R6ISL0_9SPHI|nr:TonB-dependent receptor [Pedobacter duraquae]TDO24966.1 iron complex outermembrane receptor protein [Pedobacter duraquae]
MKRFLRLIIIVLSIAPLCLRAQNTSGQLSGNVTTNDGLVAGNINIQLRGSGQNTLTNAQGFFSFPKVKPGTYILTASSVGLKKLEKQVVIMAGQTSTTDLVLQENAAQLNEIVISSAKINKFSRKKSDYVGKMELGNLENAQVYTTIPKELLNDQLIFSVDDATKNVPGLQMMWQATGRGGDGGAFYSSRGFTLQSGLRNGVAGNVTSRIDAANLESIEVIKGPSATLFGSTLTSYGGLINRVTKKPYEKFGGEVAYSSGSYGFNRISADINAPLDSAKNVLFRLNTAYNYQGSFQDNGFNKTLAIAPSLTYKVNDRLTFNLDAELYSGTNMAENAFFFYFPVAQLGADRADKLGLDYKRSYHGSDLTQSSASNNFFGQMTYKLSDQWTSQTNYTSSYSYSNGRQPYYFLVPNYVALQNPNAAPGADFISRGDQSTADSRVNITEIQQNFNGTFNLGNMKNRVVIGLDYLRQNSDQHYYSIDTFDLIPKNGNIPTYEDFNETNLNKLYGTKNFSDISYPIVSLSNTYSAYVSDVINFTDNLIGSAGLRVDRFDNKGSFDSTTGTYSGAYKQTVFSPRFGLIFQPIKDQVSIFANYQNGFTNKVGVDYQQRTFKPEHANQIEGGVKINAFGGKLSSTLSYYNIKVEDIVRAYTFDPAQPNASIQDGTKVSKGFEAEVVANPIEGFNIIAGFAYNDNKYTKSDADVEGRRDAYSMSPYSANLWASYKISHGTLQGIGIGFGGNYASDNKIVNSVSNGVFTLPRYTILNASAFYDQPKYRIGLKVNNLTNKQYWIGYGTMNPQQLRAVVGSVSFKF